MDGVRVGVVVGSRSGWRWCLCCGEDGVRVWCCCSKGWVGSKVRVEVVLGRLLRVWLEQYFGQYKATAWAVMNGVLR